MEHGDTTVELCDNTVKRCDTTLQYVKAEWSTVTPIGAL